MDSDCDGADDYDADGDGYRWDGADDCDDGDEDINPGVTDTWYDGVDEDCSAPTTTPTAMATTAMPMVAATVMTPTRM